MLSWIVFLVVQRILLYSVVFDCIPMYVDVLCGVVVCCCMLCGSVLCCVVLRCGALCWAVLYDRVWFCAVHCMILDWLDLVVVACIVL